MAQTTEHIGFRCNNCANRKCRKKFDSPSDIRRACHCINWQKPKHMANPLMLSAMHSNPKGVLDVLSAFGMHIVEKKHYPYFALIPPKRKKGKRHGYRKYNRKHSVRIRNNKTKK